MDKITQSDKSLLYQLKEKDDKIKSLEKKLHFFQSKLMVQSGSQEVQLNLLNQTYQNELLLQTITKINSFLSDANATDSILKELIEQAAMMLNCAASSILLLQEDQKTLYFKSVTGNKSNKIKEFTISIDKGISGLVVRTQKAVIINEPYAHPNFNSSFDKLTGFKTRSILCLPLFHEKEIIGVLQLLNNMDSKPFDENDLEIAKLFADQTAIAIAKSKFLEKLEEKNLELIEANKLKTNFISTISHELRTPLTPIIAWVDCLSESLDDAELLKEGLVTIKEQAYHLNRVIDSIIQLSQLEANQIFIDWQEVCFDEIFHRISNELNTLMKDFSIQIELPDFSSEPYVLADPHLMYQILFQLLDNAVKFGDKNSIIKVSLKETNKKISISIINNGPGIAQSDLKIICTTFRQLDNSLTRVQDGLGIGLTLVQGFSLLFGANFTIESSIEDRWVKAKLDFFKIPPTLPFEFSI